MTGLYYEMEHPLWYKGGKPPLPPVTTLARWGGWVGAPSGAKGARWRMNRSMIRMKEAAGREQDRIDIEHLRMRLEDNAED